MMAVALGATAIIGDGGSVMSAQQIGDDPGFASTLRQAIDASGVSLTWLRERLAARGEAVSTATLSYWRSGARHPEGAQSLLAVVGLEQLLDLEPGSLTSLVGPSKRTGPLGEVQFPIDEVKLEAETRAVYQELGTPYPRESRDVTAHSVTDVGPDGFVRRSTTRTLVQVVKGTVTETPILRISPGLRTPWPHIEVIAGGDARKRYTHPSGEVHGMLVAFDRPVTAPDTALIEWSMDATPGYPPSQETGHGVHRRCQELLIWVRFHPDARPDWIEEHAQTAKGVAVTLLSLGTGREIHRVHRSFGPGTVLIRWGFGERS